MAWAAYNRPLSDLSEPQQERLRLQADAVAEAAGWLITAEEGSRQSTTYYTRPLAPNLEGARQALVACSRTTAAIPYAPTRCRPTPSAAPTAAAFYGDDLDPALAGLVRSCSSNTATSPSRPGRSTGRGR
jgi:hypothetical protein